MSRTVADRIIDRFGLMKLYDDEYWEDARKRYREDIVSADVDSKSGIISITVEDKDPNRAAEMANAIVEELKGLTQGLAITVVSQRRLFFEEQKATKDALTKSGEELKAFQEQEGISFWFTENHRSGCEKELFGYL
jgi:tyrosine-protein kinase Etk/Wzc